MAPAGRATQLSRTSAAVSLGCLCVMVFAVALGPAARAGDASAESARATPSQLIAFTGLLDRSSRFSSLVVTKANGEVVRRVTVPRRDGLVAEADFSPSGRLIAYASRPNGRECCRDLFVRSVFKTMKRRLTSSPNTEDMSPAFGPGGRVVFISDPRQGPPRIQSIRSTGGGRQTIFSGAGGVSVDSRDLSLSPTGRRIAFTGRRGSKAGIYLVDSDGSNLTTLVEFEYTEQDQPRIVDLDFSADGESVAYILWPKTQGPTHSDVFVVSVATKETRQLTEDPNRYEDALTFAPDSRRIGITTAHKPQNIVLRIANRARTTLRLGRAHSATLLDWTTVAGS